MHAGAATRYSALGVPETEDGPADMSGFFSIIEPQFLLDSVEIAETCISVKRSMRRIG